MGRILLVFVIAAAALASPDVRAWLKPHVQPGLDPVYEWSARSRVSEVARMIQTEKAAGRSIPNPKTFGDFLERRFRGADGAMDPWGAPYYLKKERDRTVIGSAGRDGIPGTADDIREMLPGG
ncbi:MAG TPA: hypothetical protein VGR37_04570 [Longimicrobiaceae bacterium]|nr:hypothetical protein [Longimicrobiaceae bacterium]